MVKLSRTMAQQISAAVRDIPGYVENGEILFNTIQVQTERKITGPVTIVSFLSKDGKEVGYLEQEGIVDLANGETFTLILQDGRMKMKVEMP